MPHWLSATRDELAEFMRAAGQPPFRAGQVWGWLHAHRVDGFDRMTNLPAPLRRSLADAGRLRVLREIDTLTADDGLTHKWLFATADDRRVESVLIIERERRRRTVCVSCMAGCPLGCVFCATGRSGFGRNLTAGEIIEQIYTVAAAREEEDDDALESTDHAAGVSHIVFMGMGEPLLNLDAVLAAASAATDPGGLALSSRRVTVSTAGVPDGIRRLAAAGAGYRLAVSLHAADQQTRERIMPAAARWPLDELFPAIREFAAATSRAVTFEYCLIQGVNAGPADAAGLARLLEGLRCKVNLIPLNPVPGLRLRPPRADTVRRFQERLERLGVPATVRVAKGREIAAACGQLGAKGSDTDTDTDTDTQEAGAEREGGEG